VLQFVSEISVHIKSKDAPQHFEEQGGDTKTRLYQVIRLPRIMAHLILVGIGLILSTLAMIFPGWVRVILTILDLGVIIPKVLLWYSRIYGELSDRVKEATWSKLTPALETLGILHVTVVAIVTVSCGALTWWSHNFFAATRAYSLLLVIAVEFRQRVEAFIKIATDEDEDLNHTPEQRLALALRPTKLLLLSLLIVSLASASIQVLFFRFRCG
jgi:hypothetical protein